jgi:hypothetical protein
MTRYLLTASAAVLIGGVAPALAAPSTPHCGSAASSPPQPPHVAMRRLEARTERGGKHGWMDVRTTVTADGHFIYEVLQEGGSDQVRNKVLYPALKREQELVEKGAPVHMPALLVDYDCAEPQPDQNGFQRVSIRPREPSRLLVNGIMLWEPQSGAVLRVAGRLSRSPSFWVSDVDMDWEYARIADTVLPTAVHARAKVKFVGPSTFDMTYRYISVDGQLVDSVVASAGGEGRK